MNHHLNLFRFFNESDEKEFIENNLSRAFSICLSNNGFFLSEYIKGIVSQEDYDYLFSSISEDAKYSIDLQIDTALIDKVGSEDNIKLENHGIMQPGSCICACE